MAASITALPMRAPFAATLRDNAWLRHAAHANAMAARLSQGLRDAGYHLRFPTEANAVFVALAPEQDAALRDLGYAYYGLGERDWNLFRLMCSFDTPIAQVDAAVADARTLCAR